MWHSVGLTLLVFVATLLIVLLLMVCGECGVARGSYTPRYTRRLDRLVDWLVLSGLKEKKKAWVGKCLHLFFTYLSGVSPDPRQARCHPGEGRTASRAGHLDSGLKQVLLHRQRLDCHSYRSLLRF